MDNKASKREAISKGLIGLAVGVSLVVAGLLMGRQLHIVWSPWPCTDGVVMHAAVQEVFEAPSAKGEMPIRTYTPKVEFRYRVGGKDFTTEAASIYIASTYEQAAANLSHLYGMGTHHPIRYNPGNPSDIRFGVIDFSALAFSFLLLAVGVALSVAGLRMAGRGNMQLAEPAPADAPQVSAAVLPFASRASEAAADPLRCPACGEAVTASEDTCPNCRKFLRAA